MRDKSAPVRPENAGRMRLVDHQECLVPIGDRREFIKRGAIAVHAVQAFHRDPNPCRATLRAPGTNRASTASAHCARLDAHAARPARTPVARAGMNELIQYDEILALRERREASQNSQDSRCRRKACSRRERMPRPRLRFPRAPAHCLAAAEIRRRLWGFPGRSPAASAARAAAPTRRAPGSRWT